MADRTWITKGVRRLSDEHLKGVEEFMLHVRTVFAEGVHIFCPCKHCMNRKQLPQGRVEDHLLLNGMASTYDRWIHHGEPLHVVPEHAEPEHAEPEHDEPDAQGHHGDDASFDFIEDVLQDGLEKEDGFEDDRIPDLLRDLYMSEDLEDGQRSLFADVIEEAKRAAVEGGKFSRFTFIVKLHHVKSFYRISNAAFNAILHILNLCVLFRKDYAKLDNCPKCNASRWIDADGKKRIPAKVLRHFPLIPRLKRMFISEKGSEEVQWHKIKRQPVDNELSHPADGDAWKDFDDTYKDFAADARNIRLGIATDGFNPFGNMSNSYSMWPVFVVPYNLPPWACMDQSNFMMTLLVPGPESPGKDFDVFMEPLVEELQQLWMGVRTYDALSRDKFDLHAAIIWCIHDFPALHTLCGRITAGYQACVRCDKEPFSKRIRNKICFIGHRRFLHRTHRWRKSKEFNGEAETREKPSEFTKEELQQQLDKVKDVRPGKLQKKRKREEGQCFSRRSCLWDLPYWSELKLRNNLDVMHIEKNICDNLLGTFLNIEGKTKDTLNSRLDLEDLGIRKELHLRPVEDGESFEMPEAWYTMSKQEKLAFCEFIRAVRFPDGYAANLSKCVSADGCKLQGLKTHDCHILLQRILPAGLRGIMHHDIYEAVAELGNFFRELCCKTLKRDVLERLEREIPVILCKLEKIFPPSFFDVMVHLAVHLPKEALLRGPVQYGWMFPIERRLLTCKRYVRNTARPEGSIAEAYVVDECLTFCSRYFDDMETRFNRPGRNIERDDSHVGDVSVFKHGVNFIGASEYLEAGAEYDKMVWLCKEELQRQGGNINVDKWLANGFAKWFQAHIGNLQDISADLYALKCQPDKRLKGIIKLQYNSSEGVHRSVVLFRCDWFDLGGKKKIGVRDDGHFKSINTGRCWYKNDPFILTTQATKVFYVPDTALRGKWQVVQKFQHRHLWSVAENELEKGVGGTGLSYQDDNSTEVPLQTKESHVQSILRRDRECVLVDAVVVQKIKKRRKEVVVEQDVEDEEQYQPDQTMYQYCKDDEGNKTGHRVPVFGIDDDE
nr:uncharacterized protein LOC127337018 [Lolium perenne]